MVIVYTIIGRIREESGLSYTHFGYCLDKGEAIIQAHKLFRKRSTLSSIDKIIVQKVCIGPHGAAIEEIDWIYSE